MLVSLSRRQLLLSALGLWPARRLVADDKNTTFSANVKVVNVLATVRDKQGKIVRNLSKDDFTLEEDGRPQTIRYFSQETDLPLTLGLLVDTSMSQRRVLGEERSASYNFLDRVLREDKDLAFLIHFDREAELLQDLTSSRQKLERLSKETGGALFTVSKKHSIDQIYGELQEELRNQYNLGYTPERADAAGYHKIHVAPRRKNLTVQARSGYYAGR